MKLKKIIAFVTTFVMLAGFCVVFPESTENTSSIAIFAEAAEIKLAVPKNLKANAGDGKVILTWGEVKGADAYRVYIYNAETKKYEQCKFIKGTRTTVKDLENGKTYKFKVAAAVKSGKSYKTGAVSTVVAAKPTAEKYQMKETNLSIKEIAGSWVYYDFLYLKKYTSGTSYDPNKIQWAYEGWITNIQIIDEKDVIVFFATDFGKEYRGATIKNDEIVFKWEDSGLKYKIYTYGDDKYLFLQFINNGGENTYIFKYTAVDLKKQITDIDKLEGSWTAIDYCEFDLKYRDSYNPFIPLWLEELYLTGATVKDGKITIHTKEHSFESKIYKNKMDDSKYYVYEIDGDMYLYYQWRNGAGDHQFYVLKKN
ncbi:MAG: fibronectin type III domain-containing protein [Ruminococcus sp.]|nr:fibronectin type III domain-containing protein [Ruminococcus sp.]MCM1381929.1 fibronectin type III domain-containing protein [Muribaculaceae bacterium]MCM1479685.1 fibronectin type III domain-containing protein [Muribaculaceae bacterium]